MIKLDIIFEDDQIIVVNKPADMLTIPDRHDSAKPSIYGELNKIHGKVFIVHRLDRETSGIIIFAKNDVAHRALTRPRSALSVRRSIAHAHSRRARARTAPRLR